MNSKTFLYPIVVALATLTAGIAGASTNDIDGIPVIIKKKPGGAQITTATTDDSGKFTFANLREGEYAIAFPPPNRIANNFHQPQGNPAAMLVLTAYDGKPARMVLAKNYYESRSNTARLTVTGKGREDKPIKIGFTWDSIRGTITPDPANAQVMKLTYPVAPNEAGFKCGVGGCTVTGQIVAGPPVK